MSNAGQIEISGPKFKVIRGFNFAPGFETENIESGLDYKARSDDLFIVTYPKNGTTWTQQIVILLLNNGEIPDDVLEGGVYVRSPFLEANGAKEAEDLPRPNAIKTHLRFDLQPWHDEAKYIIVIRNPKDACVSFYHHTTLSVSYQFGKDRTFDEYFPFWLAGEVECGSYFDWILSWWPHRNKKNVLFVLYEDMKADPSKQIKRMAEFMGNIELSESVLEQVVEKSDFSSMAKTMKVHLNKNLRKGIVGDHKSYLNEQQTLALETMFHEKFDGTGIEKLWTNYVTM